MFGFDDFFGGIFGGGGRRRGSTRRGGPTRGVRSGDGRRTDARRNCRGRGENDRIHPAGSLRSVQRIGGGQRQPTGPLYHVRRHRAGRQRRRLLPDGLRLSAVPRQWAGHHQAVCKCKGSGRVPRKRSVKIKVPAGVHEGQGIRVAGEGEPGQHGGPNGDLYCYVRVKPHEFLERDGQNLIAVVPITLTQAALGATIEVPSLNGTQQLKIPREPSTAVCSAFEARGCPIFVRDTRATNWFRSRSRRRPI